MSFANDDEASSLQNLALTRRTRYLNTTENDIRSILAASEEIDYKRNEVVVDGN
jgi:hypothetical protein